MALILRNVPVPVELAGNDREVKAIVAAKLGLSVGEVLSFAIRKKSIDARKKSEIKYIYQISVDVSDEAAVLAQAGTEAIPFQEKPRFHPLDGLNFRSKDMELPPVIIGSGPAGTFAALVLAEAGVPAIVVERGEAVEKRMRTVRKLQRFGQLDPESNYCFGEGGAGTFSDGKLTCGRNHPLIDYLFHTWVRFGAPPEILVDAHPHIGTDFLMRMAKRMRESIEAVGTKYLFGSQFVDFRPGRTAKYEVVLGNGDVLATNHLVLALGHSARDTYEMLLARGLHMTQKPFAMGARFEHPQDEINAIQYGSCTRLPPAEYKLTAQVGDRGIWTFCMCPGGHLMPTSTQPGHLAINGMSYHARNSGFANAAVVVGISRQDFDRGHPLDGMYFQQKIEQAAYAAGGGGFLSPAQRVSDFIAGRLSKGELNSTYKPGVSSARLDQVLPPMVVESLRGALFSYNQRMRGFISENALVAGVESKTSSPVVMPRNDQLQSVSHPGIFPTGEGAGFAGGIVSASLDGVRVGRAILEDVANRNVASTQIDTVLIQ